MEPQPSPRSLEEVEALILALYEPRSVSRVSEIQEILQGLQRSPQGWLLARELLARPDENVRFFGALTLIVKLNTESNALSAGDATQLLQSLIAWFLDSLAQGGSILVARKLSSALVTFLLTFPRLWPTCLYHLLYCLATGQSVATEGVNTSTEAKVLVSTLQPQQLRGVLWVAAALVEEGAKMETNTVKNLEVYEAINQNVPTTVSIIGEALSEAWEPVVREEAVRCLQSWISFCQRSTGRGDLLISSLRPLVNPIIGAVASGQLSEVGVELLSDTLANYSGFYVESHYSSLQLLFETPWAQKRYDALLLGDFDFENVQFGQLIVAFGDARVEILMQTPGEASRACLIRLCGLLAARGYPVGDDKIFISALEFWSTFVETMADSMHSEEDNSPAWIPAAMSHLMQAVSNSWQKAAYPPAEEFALWDSSERAGFADARKDIGDFLQSVYTVAGPPIISTFAELTVAALHSQSWSLLEAAAYSLGSLADCILGDASCDSVLKTVFTSHLFDLLGQAGTGIPARVRQTSVSLIEKYSEYFERNTESLSPALNLLFSVIQDPLLTIPASKSIYRLCGSCRALLATDIDVFLDHFATLASRQDIDCQAFERIVGAISSVIQAISDEAPRLDASRRLLAFISTDSHTAIRLLDMVRQGKAISSPAVESHRCSSLASQEELPEHLAVKALRCLVNMGKGLQTPTDAPVDLVTEAHARPLTSNAELAAIQSDIMTTVVQIQRAFPSQSEVVETICNVFRAGFSEAEPGPFVMPPDVICRYLLGQSIQVPRIGAVVSMACSFASSLGKTWGNSARTILSQVLGWVIRLLLELPNPEEDTELSQNGIDFVARIASRDTTLLLTLEPQQSVEAFFFFTLRVMEGKEPLPKAAAADFWAMFMTLKSHDQAAQYSIDHAMAQLGPAVSQTLIRNIGGNASRSELDKLSEPLKKLVSQHVRAQSWLEAALRDPSFPGSRIPEEERARFLKKIISLRGSRTTNQVVREFWLAARGSNFAYAS